MFLWILSAAALTILDDAHVLSESPCTDTICEKPSVNGAKVRIALERIPSPTDQPVIVEVLPPSEEPRGDEWLHDNANMRLADCWLNMDEDKRACPFAYVMIDSSPSALKSAKVGTSSLGIGISMSPKSNAECMSNFLKSQLVNAPDQIMNVGWRSSLHLAPFALQIALPVLKDLGGPCEPEPDYFIPTAAFGTVFMTSISIVLAGSCLFFTSTELMAGKAKPAPFVPGEFSLEDGAGVYVYSKPTSESKKVAELASGPVDLRVDELKDGWLRISHPRAGWICLESAG